jgi:hypothetical protein
LKIGALRLGEEFVYVSRGAGGEVRVFGMVVCKDEDRHKEDNREECY